MVEEGTCEKDTLGWMRKAHWIQKGQTKTEKGIVVFRRALKLLERAHAEFSKAYGGVEKMWTEKRIHSDE